MRVEVTASNDGGSTTALSEPGPLLGHPPSFKSGRPPALSGTPRAGETVHADPGSTVPASQITYTWTRCSPSTGYCETINPGSLGLTLRDADVGQRISFTAVARNQFGKSLPWTVTFPGPVAPRAGATPTPTPTAAPTATPTATATATATPRATPEPTATATPRSSPPRRPRPPGDDAAPGPPPAPDRVLVPDRTPTSPSPARAPRARLTATRTRVTVTLTAPAPHQVTVRLLSGRTLLGRATLRPDAKRATVALTKQGKAALRRHRTITLETRTAAGTSRTRTCSRAGANSDAGGDVLGVVLDPAEQRRAAGVLPGHPEEVQAWAGGHAALVHEAAVGVEDRARRSTRGRGRSRSPRARRRRRAGCRRRTRTVEPVGVRWRGGGS